MKSGKSQHRCHVFLRSNRHGDDANRDLRHQYQSVLNYARSHNMEIVESLYVQGSAQSQATMSAIEQVFERKSKLNDFDKLLAVSWDRFTRYANAGMALQRAATELGITIVTIQDPAEVDEISAPEVSRIFKKYLSGKKIKEIRLYEKKEEH